MIQTAKTVVLETKAIFIAHAGAAKMDGQGYRFERDHRIETKATVIAPTGKRYGCNVGPKHRYCGCPFFLDNKICKHLVWLSEKIDEDNHLEAFYGANHYD